MARVPRKPVDHYLVLAYAARDLSGDALNFDNVHYEFQGPIDGYFDTLVKDAAKVLTHLAWRPWWGRVRYRIDLWRIRNRALEFDDDKIKRSLAWAQKNLTKLPGNLSQLPGVEDPPQFVQLPKGSASDD
ncbi:MAG: hypothetical protein WAV90_17950 [Gordonia amarae]